LDQIKENPTNNCDLFFKFITSVRGGHCGYWPWAPKI